MIRVLLPQLQPFFLLLLLKSIKNKAIQTETCLLLYHYPYVKHLWRSFMQLIQGSLHRFEKRTSSPKCNMFCNVLYLSNSTNWVSLKKKKLGWRCKLNAMTSAEHLQKIWDKLSALKKSWFSHIFVNEKLTKNVSLPVPNTHALWGVAQCRKNVIKGLKVLNPFSVGCFLYDLNFCHLCRCSISFQLVSAIQSLGFTFISFD